MSEYDEASVELDRDEAREGPFRFSRRRFQQPSLFRNAAVVARHSRTSASLRAQNVNSEGVSQRLFSDKENENRIE